MFPRQLFKTQYGFEGDFGDDGPILVSNHKGMPVYDGTSHNHLSYNLPGCLSGFGMRLIDGGEFCSFRILLNDAVFANMKIVLGHTFSIKVRDTNFEPLPLFPADSKTLLSSAHLTRHTDRTVAGAATRTSG